MYLLVCKKVNKHLCSDTVNTEPREITTEMPKQSVYYKIFFSCFVKQVQNTLYFPCTLILSPGLNSVHFSIQTDSGSDLYLIKMAWSLDLLCWFLPA